MTEFICQSCGTYESKNNLLFCGNCGESHHFFCQIQNANLVPLRVLASLASNIQSINCVHYPKNNGFVPSVCSVSYAGRPTLSKLIYFVTIVVTSTTLSASSRNS